MEVSPLLALERVALRWPCRSAAAIDHRKAGQLQLSQLGQLQREHSRTCKRRATGSVQPVQRFPLTSHVQRPQGFELIIVTRQNRSLIKSTQVNAHRLEALAVELSEIQLLPVIIIKLDPLSPALSTLPSMR